MSMIIVKHFFYNLPDPTATEDDDNAEEDEDKYVDEVDMPGTKVCIICTMNKILSSY